MSQPAVLIVGSANVDLVTRVPRCPKPGESLIGRSFATVPGGKGANQAVAAARLGARAHFAGCVGRDPFGDLLVGTLSAAGVDISHLKRHPTEPTGTAVILVAEEGQNSIVVTPASNFGLTPGDMEALRPMFGALDALLVQLEIPMETVGAALRLAHDARVMSILDAGPAQAVPEEILRKADIVSPNETEAEAITGVAINSLETARQAATTLREMGAKEVVLKLGSQGAFYLGEEWLHVPAFEVQAVDTTAAGDAFTAALAVAWRRMPHFSAIRFANAAGALATTVAGAQPSMPSRAAVDAFLQNRK